MFILFEGVDGSGKTTLARMLANKIGAVYVSGFPDFLATNQLRNIIDEEISLEARCLYYLFGNICVSENIKQIRDSQIVVCDRYLDSTLSIHKLLGVEISDSFLSSFHFEKPDIAFFIFTSNEKERRERIEKRGKKTKYDTMKEDDYFRLRYVEYFKAKGHFVFVDTSGETEEESLERIGAYLKKGGLHGARGEELYVEGYMDAAE